MKARSTSILFTLIILLMTQSSVWAKISKLDVFGEVSVIYVDSNNTIDKTSTLNRSDGSAAYDDVDSHMRASTKLGIRAWFLKNVTGVVEFHKGERLWGLQNDIFNQDHYQTLGELLGDPNPPANDAYTGFKLTQAYVKCENLFDVLGFTFGRQSISATSWPGDLSKDLVLNMATDGLRADLKLGKLDLMGFKSKLNDSTADLYDTSGGLRWDTKYEDKDYDAWGVMAKSNRLFPGQSIRVYGLNGLLRDPNKTNVKGKVFSKYDDRYTLGGRLEGELGQSGLTYWGEFAYQLGDKYVSTYTYTRIVTPTTVTQETKTYYGTAKHSGYAYIGGGGYSVDVGAGRFKLLGQYIGGTGDDSTTPDIDEGFVAFNQDFHNRTRGCDQGGWGEIYKANPYQPNEFAGDLPYTGNPPYDTGTPPYEVGDMRLVDQGICNYPASILNAGFNYELAEGKLKGLGLGADYFYFATISPDGVIVKNEQAKYERVTELGNEVDFQLWYGYKSCAYFRLVYAVFMPGSAYLNGIDPVAKKIKGTDNATMLKFEASFYF